MLLSQNVFTLRQHFDLFQYETVFAFLLIEAVAGLGELLSFFVDFVVLVDFGLYFVLEALELIHIQIYSKLYEYHAKLSAANLTDILYYGPFISVLASS